MLNVKVQCYVCHVVLMSLNSCAHRVNSKQMCKSYNNRGSVSICKGMNVRIFVFCVLSISTHKINNNNNKPWCMESPAPQGPVMGQP